MYHCILHKYKYIIKYLGKYDLLDIFLASITLCDDPQQPASWDPTIKT